MKKTIDEVIEEINSVLGKSVETPSDKIMAAQTDKGFRRIGNDISTVAYGSDGQAVLFSISFTPISPAKNLNML